MDTNGATHGVPAKLMEKIEKLLRLSDSANEHEAASAAAKVQALLQNYNLELADVEHLKDNGRERKLEVAMVRIPFLAHIEWIRKRAEGKRTKEWLSNARTPWEVDLSHAIARNFFLKVLFTKHDLIFIGTPDNLEVGTYAYAQMTMRFWALSGVARNKYVVEKRKWLEAWDVRTNPKYYRHPKWHGSTYDPYALKGSEHPDRWREAWLMGAVVGLASKLDAQRNAFMDMHRVEGTVLVRNFDAAIDGFMREAFPSLYKDDGSMKDGKAFFRNREINSEAWGEGYLEGKNTDLHKGLGGESVNAPQIKETKRIRG